MGKNDGHRVKAIAKIMRDYSQGDQKSYFCACLKANSDRDAVEQTVKSQPGGRQRTKFRLVNFRGMHVFTRSVHRRVALKRKKGQEADRGERYVRGPAVKRKDLGQYVEESHCYDGSGTETKQEMKAIAKPKGGYATQPGGDERNRSKNDRHESHGLVTHTSNVMIG